MTTSFKKIIIFAVLAIALVAAAAAWKYWSGRPTTNDLVLSGTIEADEIQVGSRIGGRIAQVLVKEGQTVKRDEVLIRFESYDLEARRADASAAVAQAEAALDKALNGARPEEIAAARAQAEAAKMNLELARNGPRRQEIDAARAELNAATAEYDVAKTSLARIEKLLGQGVVSQQDYDNAKANHDRAKARRDAAQERLELLEAGTRHEEIDRAERQFRQAEETRKLLERGTRKEDIAAARAQLNRAKAALQQIETQLGELEVRAPTDAFVDVLQVRPGDLINPNAPVATLIEVDRLWVRVYVPEPEKGFVQLETDVAIYVDSFPQEAFRGAIEHIAARGEFTPRNVQTREERTHQVFAVRVRLDNRSRKLSAGMAADVVIARK